MKKVLVRRILRAVQRRIGRRVEPGGDGRLANYLDRRAARRVLESIIAKTNDVKTVHWLGRPIWQYPLDLWIIQEMIAEQKPDLVVETGTHLGGSAYFFANICDLLDHGQIISIDIAAQGTMPHPRITYVQSSSTDPAIIRRVANRIREIGARKILIMLDSDHSEQHVRQELEVYAPLVPVGSFIHVQDGCIDELRCLQDGRPGPVPAVKSFLNDHPQFIRDTGVELRYVMTAHPYGWLRRVVAD